MVLFFLLQEAVYRQASLTATKTPFGSYPNTPSAALPAAI